MSRELSNGLWVTEHRKSGKMEDKDSVMISHPDFCDKRSCGVCGRCYSKRLASYRPNLREKQEQNTRVLKSPYFKPCRLNMIDDSLRWVSMGELHNKRMFLNICRMAEFNDHINHQIWTKRAGIIRGETVPDNLTLVWSATKLNVSKPFVPSGYKIGFFVYSDENKIPAVAFHCQKKCSDCGFCYRPGASGIVAEVIR